MSEENIETVRRVFGANRSGSLDAVMEVAAELVGPDLEFVSRITAVEGSTYRGHDGLRRYFEDMSDAFREWRNDVNEMTAVRPGTVLVDNTFHGTGKSGVAVELRSFIVCVLAHGRVVRLHAFPSREEALEAAGVSG